MTNLLHRELGPAGTAILVVFALLMLGAITFLAETKRHNLEEDPYKYAKQFEVLEARKLCANGRCMYELYLSGFGNINSNSKKAIEPGDKVWVTTRCNILDRAGPCGARILTEK